MPDTPYRYAVCRECGKKWNVAQGQYIPKSGYLCPACTYGWKHEPKRKEEEMT